MGFTYSFVATEANGTEHTVNVYQMKTPSNPPSGPQRMATGGGRSVKVVSKGVYDILFPARLIRITSNDPKAP